jgi:Nucleotidyltransferase of unknown function (DUF6036)
MAASIRDSLLGYLGVLDRRLVDTGKSTPLYLSGGAAVVLAYGSTERTKDVDAFVAQRNEVLEELQGWAGKNTAVAKREGYFFEVVPPIYPMAPGMFERALPIDGLNLQAITPFAIELHDIIITKLGRYHAKDRSDIELLTRVPVFRHERLTELYALTRDDLKTYWADKLEKTDRNFNLVRAAILGLPPEDFGDDYD